MYEKIGVITTGRQMKSALEGEKSSAQKSFQLDTLLQRLELIGGRLDDQNTCLENCVDRVLGKARPPKGVTGNTELPPERLTQVERLNKACDVLHIQLDTLQLLVSRIEEL